MIFVYLGAVLVGCLLFSSAYLLWMQRQRLRQYKYKKENIKLELEPFDELEVDFEEEEVQRKNLLIHIDV